MKLKPFWFPLVLVLLSTGVLSCGNKPQEARLAAPEIPASPPAPRGRYEHRDNDGALQKTEHAAPPHAAAEQERSAQDLAPLPSWRRPGLATAWGEQRQSRISEVSFSRQSASPLDVVSMFYDDADGVHAASQRHKSARAGVFPVRDGALTISVVDAGGAPLPAVFSGGQLYVIGESGDRYQLQVQNHTPGRFEVVATVDGLDVVDGQDGSLDKRGYVIDPWGTLTIEGFRESYETIRAFRFGDVASSYATSRGKGANIGVIGVALFAEEGFYWDDEVRRRRDADPFPGRFALPPGG